MDKAQYNDRCYIFVRVILIRIIFKQTAEVNQVDSIPDNLSSHGIIYDVVYLVHNRHKMQPSKFKFRIKFHIFIDK